MFDDLFKKYGKVVFRRNDKQPATSEIDDDAESLSCKLPDPQITILTLNTRKFYYFLIIVCCLFSFGLVLVFRHKNFSWFSAVF